MMPWRRALVVAIPLGLLLLSAACASQGALEETRAQLTALQQRAETTTQELEASRGDMAKLNEGLSTATADMASAKADLTAAQAEVAKLKDGLTTAMAEVARVKADLTATSNSLSDLKSTFLTSRQDQDKRQAKADKVEKLMLVANLYVIAGAVNSRSAFDSAAAAVTDATRATGEAEIVNAWTGFLTTFQKYLASLESDEVVDVDVGRAEDAFLALLRQKLVEAQK